MYFYDADPQKISLTAGKLGNDSAIVYAALVLLEPIDGESTNIFKESQNLSSNREDV